MSMPKKSKEEMKEDKDLLSKSPEPMKVSEEKVQPKPVSKVRPKKARPARKFSFEQWAKRKGVKAHWMAGLRAYCSNPHKARTLEEWEKCFKDY